MPHVEAGISYFVDLLQFIDWADSAEQLMTIGHTKYKYPLTEAPLHRYLAEEKNMSFKIVDLTTGNAIGNAEIIFGAMVYAKLIKY